jgi:N-acetylglucosamine malate deacetylase 2
VHVAVGVRIAIIAAHPDDETIGASALVAAHETLVIHVTDGAPRAARWWPAGVIDRDGYAHDRACEVERALALAGANRVALGVTDQEAAYALPELVRVIAGVLARRAVDLVVTHAYEGGHPDHDAVAFAVARAALLVSPAPPVIEMAVYHGAPGHGAPGHGAPGHGAPGHGAPGALVAGHFIDDRGSFCRALTPAELALRRAMLACFTSQRATLAPFIPLVHERYRRAPVYDFSRPPHAGPLLYERLGFPMSGARWRALAARAWNARCMGART